MDYLKLRRREKALELVEFIKRIDKFNQLKKIGPQNEVVDLIVKEKEILDNKIEGFKNSGSLVNDYYSEFNNSLKMNFVASTHVQTAEKSLLLNQERTTLNQFMTDAKSVTGQHEVIEKKLKKCHEVIKKEMEKKYSRDCL